MKWQLGAAIATLSALAIVGIAMAASGPFGRDYNTSYFSGTSYPGTDMVFEPFGTSPLTNTVGLGPDCYNNCSMTSFEAEFAARLNDASSVIDQGRAAALIDMMLGQSGVTFGTSPAGITYAQNNFQNWENMLAVYNSGSTPGYSVQWNADINFSDPGFSGWTAIGETGTAAFGDQIDCTHGQDCIGDLDLQDNDGNPGVDPAVDFDANGQEFIIRQGCGCTTGDGDTALPTPSWTLSGTSATSPTTVTAGKNTQVTFTHTITNRGPDSATYPENINYYYPNSTTLVSQPNSGTQTTASGSSYSYSDQETIPSSAQAGQQYCESISYGNATGPLTAYETSPESCVTVAVQPCTDALSGILSPWQPDASSPVILNFPAASSGTETVTYSITGPNGFTENGGPVTVASGIGSYNIGSITLPTTGTYSVVWTPSGYTSCSQNISVVDLPYFNVLGGDVIAGAGMDVDDTCKAEDPDGGLASWNQEDAGYGGAGTQYAALALNLLQDFSTGTNSTLAPSGLSFSNSGNVSTGGDGHETDTYGGGIGSLPCTPDFFTPPSNPTSTTNQTITTVPPGTNTQYITGNVIINLASQVPNGARTTMYVDGDVYINSDIDFSGIYASVDDIPAFNVVASGNIYINSSVGEVDGIYVAEPDTANGNGVIYTCAAANGYTFTAASLDSSIDAACSNHLDVYGSFIARQIWLLRTDGTLATNQPAETFHYTPEVWMTGGIEGSDTSYNGITDLPPTL
jgi:hypothetical protein